MQALKAGGHVVAMAGDGVNDAPSLKNAEIGFTMGITMDITMDITGTEVKKEAAAVVLADDNFASIVGAVKTGRTIRDNSVQFVRFHLSTSVGAIHILWIALVLQVLVVNRGSAQAVSNTVSLTPGAWLLATGIAASVLLLDEARKLAVRYGCMIRDRKALHGVAADR